MKKRKKNALDSRLQTPPGHYLKNAPWRQHFVEETSAKKISSQDSVVLAFLIISSVAVAAALWMNPPHLKNQQSIQGQAILAGHRVPRPYNGLGYDPNKFE